MPKNNKSGKTSKSWIIAIIIAIIGAGVFGYSLWSQKDADPVAPQIPKKILVPIKPPPVIDYNELDKDIELKELMQERKAKYGLNKGIDIITKSDESIKIKRAHNDAYTHPNPLQNAEGVFWRFIIFDGVIKCLNGPV